MAAEGVRNFKQGDDIYIVEIEYAPSNLDPWTGKQRKTLPFGHPDTLPSFRHRVFLSVAGLKSSLAPLKEDMKTRVFGPQSYKVFKVQNGQYTEETGY